MSQMTDPMLNEFREEAAVTKRVLERVPADKLTWKPHQKSMSLGQLAIHIASIPGRLSYIVAQQDRFEPNRWFRTNSSEGPQGSSRDLRAELQGCRGVPEGHE